MLNTVVSVKRTGGIGMVGGGSVSPGHVSAASRELNVALSVLSPLHRAYKTIEDDDLKFPLIYGEGKKVRFSLLVFAPRQWSQLSRAPPDPPMLVCRKHSRPLFPLDILPPPSTGDKVALIMKGSKVSHLAVHNVRK